jgi:hypothetical protein
MKMSPKNVTGKYVAGICSEENAEWNYNTKGRGNFLHKSKQQPRQKI